MEEALLGEPKGYVEFYLFPKTKQNMRAQEAQKIGYLASKAKKYTEKEYKKINDPSLVSMEMVFNEEVKSFLESI